MASLFESSVQKKFLRKLLSWYKKKGRHNMPWRKTKDPYAVFLSEFMLQQTTVATVKPYYERFLKKFPTIRSLANGDLNDVLALWSGLGYYARARNLLSAMRVIEFEFGGKIPSDLVLLQRLPGVGPYTAGAIASFAFNRPAAVLDGNIIRVLMRILAIEDDPKMKEVRVVLQKVGLELAELSVKVNRARSQKKFGGPRDVNLALMDLGSTICLPQNPKCGECPATEFCLAKFHGRQNEIPLRGETPERPTVRRLFAVISFQGKWLVGQRPQEGLFGGLWEFIGADAPANIEPVNFLEDQVRKEVGFPVQVVEALPAFEHHLTHRVFVVRTFLCKPVKTSSADLLPKKGLKYEAFKWISPTKLHQMGISTVTKRILVSLPTPK